MNIDGKAKAAFVKDHVTMGDVIARYYHPGRIPGRTSCPFHGGEHDNLGYDKRVFHCFVCGAKGDAITFVQCIRGVSFPEALELLNADFKLGLDTQNKAQREALEAAQRARDKAAAMEKARRRRAHRTFILFTRVMRWIRMREIQTAVHTAQLEYLDRQTDFIMGGGDYTADPKAAARAAVQRVREAEKEARNAG